MSTPKVKLLFIDKDMNTVEIEVDQYLFRELGIKGENVKRHKSKRALNVEITEFLNKFVN